MVNSLFFFPFKIFRKCLNFIFYKIRYIKLKKKQLSNFDFTIISDNCLAGSIYKDLGLKFNTPTIGMFFCGNDFVRFASDLDYYLSCDFIEAKVSRWVGETAYPLALIGDVELHLLHYNSFEDARTKWFTRVKRINRSNIFFTMTDRDYSTYQDLVDFDRLPVNKKIFCSKEHSAIKSLVFCKKYSKEQHVGVIVLNLEYSDYFDLKGWLNND
ncbi:DUF1919 domain-containing protein [Aeromonas enteropelogenes]|uniref:DUF1919 domain-containing protein n=1 Tax=Aeromonas enteropelogenes TaxID=29489 RepID=UPI003B9E66BB